MKNLTLLFKKVFSITLFVFTMALLSTSCKKSDGCYDAQLERQFRNSFCTADCPGVIGCDGKTYCNECEANRNGIRVD
jgi:hypothetical protein